MLLTVIIRNHRSFINIKACRQVQTQHQRQPSVLHALNLHEDDGILS